MRIRAGSLLKAHGGFLMLHLDDLLTDGQLWVKLRRFLRSKRLQIEEPGSALTSNARIPRTRGGGRQCQNYSGRIAG
jgi:predicted ATP-dependent protease